ncbi:hypothetical protein AX17_000987 [Amanita inopinata Kibby_2008]|nr:hypothetical protein AX17_000987 [Amanita inopinata Kibby_2008]
MPSSECRTDRHVLFNRTNDPETPTQPRQVKNPSSWLPTPPATGSRVDRSAKRSADADNKETSKKRARLSKGADSDDPFLDNEDSDASTSAYESESDDEGPVNPRTHRGSRVKANTGFLPCSRLNALMNPFGNSSQASSSTRTILESFVSSHKSDVFKCQSTNENTYLTPPYACAYSHAAKTGGKPLLAVATEQGSVHVLDTTKREDWDVESQRTTLQPHENGIFDIKWCPSDILLATCSGDRSVRISCPRKESVLHVLRGHTHTVKCVAWDGNHRDLLATGGRDGSICLWDLRLGKRRQMDESEDVYATSEPVVVINGAHEEAHLKGGKAKTRRGKKNPLPRTVTGLLYPDSEPYGLISSGAFDGILRYWDLRQPTSNRTRSTKMKTLPCLYSTTQDPTTLHGSRRSRGIISLASGHGPTAGILYGLGADSRVHAYTLPRLDAQESVDFSHEHLQSSSFYVGLSVSPCGQWLASGGGTRIKGSGFLFDIANSTRPWKQHEECRRGVELRGQLGEVGAVDWAQDMVAMCADDGTVRVWRPDVEVHNNCVAQPDDNKWTWSWAIPGSPSQILNIDSGESVKGRLVANVDSHCYIVSRSPGLSVLTMNHVGRIRIVRARLTHSQARQFSSEVAPRLPTAPSTRYVQPTHKFSQAAETKAILERASQCLLPVYIRPDFVLSHGKGAYVWDTEGNKYLDFTAGIAVNALGHADDGVVKVLTEQAGKLLHTSNAYHHEWSVKLAELLVTLTQKEGGLGYATNSSSQQQPSAKVFFANSGTEANEGALKIARKMGKDRWTAATGISWESDPSKCTKTRITCFEQSFHGRSMGALSVTSNPKYQIPFMPLIPGVDVGKLNEFECIPKVVNEDTCAVIVEPIQGEGGINTAQIDWLMALRKRCDEVGAVLIFDEIQCGLYRTGTLWAHSTHPTECHPDIVTMAKPLANGYPIGAVLMRDSVASCMAAGTHGTTFGGSPLACAIGHHVLSRLTEKSALQRMTETSAYLRERLGLLPKWFPGVLQDKVRGRGLILGLGFKDASHAAQVVNLARERGVFVLSAGKDAVRLVPSLMIGRGEADVAVDVLEGCLAAL